MQRGEPDENQSLSTWLRGIDCGDMHYTLFHKLQFKSVKDIEDLSEQEINTIVTHEAMKEFQPGSIKRLKRNLRELRQQCNADLQFVVISESDQQAIKELNRKKQNLAEARDSNEELLEKLAETSINAQETQKAAFEKAERLLDTRKVEAIKSITAFEADKRKFILQKLNTIELAESQIDTVEDRVRNVFKNSITERPETIPGIIEDARTIVEEALRSEDISLDAPLGFRSDDIEEELHRLGRLSSTSLSAKWSVDHVGSELQITGPQAVKCDGHWGTVRSTIPLPTEGITEWKICFNVKQKNYQDPVPSYTFVGVVNDQFTEFESSVFGCQEQRRFAVGIDSFVDKPRYGHVYAGFDDVEPECFGLKSPILNGVEIQIVANMDNNSLSFYDNAGDRIARCWLPNSYALAVSHTPRHKWYPAVSLRGEMLCTMRC